MALKTRPPAILRFGIFEVDTRAGELRKHGVRIKLQEQPFHVLTVLLQRPGEVVTREELRNQNWPPDTFVDFDNSLNTAINKLRETLGDSADNPRFIETLPRRGYRFIAPVTNVQQRKSRASRLSWLIAFVAAGALIAAGTSYFGSTGRSRINSVAVLPFVNGSADPNAEYLSDGIAESLINNLSQVPNLRVMARTTAFRYKGKDADPQKAGNELHVRAVVSGKLLKQGDTLVVQAELTDVATGSQLWGGRYNRKAADVFALQDDLSAEISDKLRLRLTGDQKKRFTKRYTDDAEAYQLYLKGRYHWNKRTPEGVRKAMEYFQQAIDKDSTYALAYAGLADAYTYSAFFGAVPPHEAMPKAKAAALKALEIDDQLPEAHVSLGYVSFTYDWDWSAAGKHFDQALALNPPYATSHAFYHMYLSSLGRPEEAVAVARRALSLDPASPAVSHSVAVQLYLARQFDASIEQCWKTLEMDPNFAIAYGSLGQLYAAKGMYGESLRQLEKYTALTRGNAESIALSGYLHARLGERSQALQSIEELKADSKQRFVPASFLALVYEALGEKDQAFAWLEKGYQERFTRFAYLRQEPLWDPLRSDPRFADLVRRVGMPQ